MTDYWGVILTLTEERDRARGEIMNLLSKIQDLEDEIKSLTSQSSSTAKSEVKG